VGGCLLSQFSQRVRRVDSLEDTDLEVVVEVVFLTVGSDPELFGN